MDSKFPIVSVLMPVYNGAQFLQEAIDAVLNQTFQQLELIIVNDGSTDESDDIIKKNIQDPRVVYISYSQNLGIVKALNIGLKSVKGKYIVRTDSDDICLPHMIELFIQFMESHVDYVACGGAMEVIGSGNLISYPNSNKTIRIHALNYCPFSHSTLILRVSALKENNLEYSEKYTGAEDYYLWLQLMKHGKFFNLKTVTLKYRESNSQVTKTINYQLTIEQKRKDIYAYIGQDYFELSENESILYAKYIFGEGAVSTRELEKIGELLLKILNHNNKTNFFDKKMLRHFLFTKWHFQCMNSYALGRQVFIIYFKIYIASKSFSRGRSLLLNLKSAIIG